MLRVGIVRRPHGLQGEVSVEPATDLFGRFRPGARLVWERGGARRGLRLSSARRHGRRALLLFEEVETLEGARELAGGDLFLDGEEGVDPPRGDFYYSHEISGWRCEDARGRFLGAVAALEQTPAGPLLAVETARGKSALVPFVEGIVVSIDRDSRLIVLDPPEGLLEL